MSLYSFVNKTGRSSVSAACIKREHIHVHRFRVGTKPLVTVYNHSHKDLVMVFYAYVAVSTGNDVTSSRQQTKILEDESTLRIIAWGRVKFTMWHSRTSVISRLSRFSLFFRG